eukprot:m51a1_g310 hypothetical protein (2394) ;mRNA; f:402502-410085
MPMRGGRPGPFAGIEGFGDSGAAAAGADSPMTPAQLRADKITLLNIVSASLVKEPRYDGANTASSRILALVRKVAAYDPEFVLKVALYARTELNVRSTPNLVLAAACSSRLCAPFVRRYFAAAVRLPSDWIDVAATYQTLPDKSLSGNAIPTCLRKAMVAKFPEFDAYQLAKYNNEGALKRKKKKLRERAERQQGGEGGEGEGGEAPRAQGKPAVTMKQLIRQLHMSAPVQPIMCILGKKYPASEEEFRRLGLPGEYRAGEAGRRMKLPTAETWETLLSQKGNRAETWEELIEHKKLPFMAMLRNLRNLLFTGVHPRYHRWVMNKLTNARTVASSRQFPMRFLSAYEAIPADLDEWRARLDLLNNPPAKKPRTDAPASEQQQQRRRRKHPFTPAHVPPPELFAQYREALDTAVKLATAHNVKPIRGATLVLCDAGPAMQAEAEGAAAGAGGGRLRALGGVAALLGLMCQHACEDCELRVFGPGGDAAVELLPGAILDNVAVVEQRARAAGVDAGGGESPFPVGLVEQLVSARRRVDNVLVLSSRLLPPSGAVGRALAKYRQEVNARALFVSVDLSGRGCAITQGDAGEHPHDVLVSGFSDAILRFVAERGDAAQLQHVEHIDVARALPPLPPAALACCSPLYARLDGAPPIVDDGDGDARMRDTEPQSAAGASAGPVAPVIGAGPAWRVCRVFISSTFADMHGERDLLVRKVFPELRERCAARRVALREVDLRWGVTEAETQDAQGLRLCLDEVAACAPFFVGLVGSRYGWCPPDYAVPRGDPAYDWVRAYPPGRSVTELEMYAGAVRCPNPRAFFYMRAPGFADCVPAEHRRAFAPESPEAAERLDGLRAMVRGATRNVVTYGATWGGVVDGRPVAAGLAPLHRRVLDDLWANICAEFPDDDGPASAAAAAATPEQRALAEERGRQDAAIAEHTLAFVGRREQLERLARWADGPGTGALLLAGPAGVGKSALAAEFARRYQEARAGSTLVVPVFVPARGSLRRLLWRLCAELAVAAGEQRLPELSAGARELSRELERLAEAASYRARVLLVVDGADQLDAAEDRAHALEWLPAALRCKALVSAAADSEPARVLGARAAAARVDLAPLELLERRLLVRARLAAYGKKLDEGAMNDQMRALLRKPDAGRPLYLCVAADELRACGVFEDLTERVRALQGTLPRLLDDVLARVERDHGRALVAQALAALACARGGLRVDELLALLRRPPEPALPAALWSRVAASLATFLRAREAPDGSGPLVDFAHAQLRAAAERRYVSGPARAGQQAHCQLAAVFLAAADPQHDGTFAGSARGLGEAVHHLCCAGLLQQAATALTSLAYVERKASAGLVAGLLADYAEACAPAAAAAKDYAALGAVRQFGAFVSSRAHVLAARPHLVFQEAANQPDGSAPAAEAARVWAAARERRAWLRWVNKPQAADACRLTLSGAADAVLAVAFSPRGDLVASGSADCCVRVSDAATGRDVACLAGAHGAAVVSVAWSPDGRLLASGSWDCTARVWDGAAAGTFSAAQTLAGHAERLSCVLFTADSARLVTAAWDATVRVWSLADGAQLACLDAGLEGRPVNALSLCEADPRLVLAADWGGRAVVWDLEAAATAKPVRTIAAHERSAKACAYTRGAGGSQAVSASSDGRLRLWDASEGALVGELGRHALPVNALAVSPSGAHVASASDDGSARVWDAAVGRQVGAPRTCLADPAAGGPAPALLTLALSADGRRALTATSDCDVVVWDVGADVDGAEFTPAGTLRGHTQLVNAAEFSPAGDVVATASADGTVRVWDARALRQLRSLGAPQHSAGVNSVAFSPDGQRMASASDDFSVVVWDAGSGAWAAVQTLRGHTAQVRCVAYAPSGKLLASAARDGTVRVWHAGSGRLLHTMSGHLDWINACAWSPDSKKLATASFDFNAKLWSMRKGCEVRALSGHSASVEAVRFSPDGATLATASCDGTLKIWDARRGSERATLRGHSGRVASVVYARSGAWVASAGEDGTLRRWALTASNEAARLAGHSGLPARACAFSPDGETLATAGDDCAVRLWSWREASGAGAQRSRHHAACVTSAAFSAGGETLATAGADGALKLWDTASAGARVRTVPGAHGGAALRCVAFAPDEQPARVATAGDDGSLRLWDVPLSASAPVESPAWLVQSAHAGRAVRAVSLARGGRLAATGGWDGHVRLWAVGGGAAEAPSACVWDAAPEGGDWVDCVAFSPSGRTLASAGRDDVVRLWDVAAGAQGRPQAQQQQRAARELCGHANWVTSVSWALAPHGAREVLATSSWDGTVAVWDPSDASATAPALRLGAAGGKPVAAAQVAPNGRHVVSACADGTLRLWDTRRPDAPMLEFVAAAPASAVAVSARAQLIAAGDALGTAYLLKYLRRSA